MIERRCISIRYRDCGVAARQTEGPKNPIAAARTVRPTHRLGHWAALTAAAYGLALSPACCGVSTVPSVHYSESPLVALGRGADVFVARLQNLRQTNKGTWCIAGFALVKPIVVLRGPAVPTTLPYSMANHRLIISQPPRWPDLTKAVPHVRLLIFAIRNYEDPETPPIRPEVAAVIVVPLWPDDPMIPITKKMVTLWRRYGRRRVPPAAARLARLEEMVRMFDALRAYHAIPPFTCDNAAIQACQDLTAGGQLPQIADTIIVVPFLLRNADLLPRFQSRLLGGLLRQVAAATSRRLAEAAARAIVISHASLWVRSLKGPDRRSIANIARQMLLAHGSGNRRAGRQLSLWLASQ